MIRETRTYMVYTADTLRALAKGLRCEYPNKTFNEVLQPAKLDERTPEQIVVDTLLRIKEGAG